MPEAKESPGGALAVGFRSAKGEDVSEAVDSRDDRRTADSLLDQAVGVAVTGNISALELGINARAVRECC